MSANEIQKHGGNPVAIIRNYLNAESVKARLDETLGKRAGAFANSIINVVRGNNALQKCTPDSVMSAAMVAATMNLPIDPVLGQAAIVPYGNQACFQIMYRGVIQLCIRSGQYATIHCSEIYADELKSHNPITGVVEFNPPETFKMRDDGKDENVVGHYAYFRLAGGFEKGDFMTHKAVMVHARKYSKAYQRDLRKKSKDCPWSTDPILMGNKTVLLRLLKKYGLMSIELQDAVVADHSYEAAQAEASDRIDADAGSEPIDVNFEENSDSAQNEELDEATQKKIADQKAALNTPAPDPEIVDETQEVPDQFVCKGKCKETFVEPAQKKGPKGSGPIYCCPKCGSLRIEALDTSGEAA